MKRIQNCLEAICLQAFFTTGYFKRPQAIVVSLTSSNKGGVSPDCVID